MYIRTCHRGMSDYSSPPCSILGKALEFPQTTPPTLLSWTHLPHVVSLSHLHTIPELRHEYSQRATTNQSTQNAGTKAHSGYRSDSRYTRQLQSQGEKNTIEKSLQSMKPRRRFQMSQGLNRPPRAKARTYPETCESRKDGGQPPRTPKIHTVALPGEEDGEDFSNGGFDFESDLRGGLMGTLDGDPEAILLGCLDDIFPELFTIRN